MFQEYLEEVGPTKETESIVLEKESTEENGLKLGDIITIIAPQNDLLHDHTFFIEYINDIRIVLIDVATTDQTQINRDEITGEFTDQSIQEIILLSRGEADGYARQNKLLPGVWIEIHIGGDVSTILTGEITSLEEDQIEIRTVPEMDVIYIDFEYKGIPEYIPIKSILIRDKPATYKSIKSAASELEELGESKESQEPSFEYLETGEVIIHAEEDAEEEENVLDILRREVAKSKEVIFGEDLEDVIQYKELPESQRRYGIDLQTTSLLDELLSTIPSTQRNQRIMQKVHTLIARYKELRNRFSIFDENGDVRNLKRNDANLHKPLVDHIKNMDGKLDWVLPVVSTTKKIYVADEEDFEAVPQNDDVSTFVFDNVLNEEENIKKTTYYNERTVSDESKYYKLYQQLSDLMRPFENPVENPNFLASVEVRSSMEAIVDNLDEFNSSVMKIGNANARDILSKRRYVIQKYDLGLNRRMQQMRGDREVTETVPLTRADTMTVKSLVVLPASVMNYSRLHLPNTNLLEKSNIHMFPLMLFKILKKNKDIAPFIIEDLTQELYHDAHGKEEEKEKEDVTEATRQKEVNEEFLTNIRHYVLSDNLRGVDEDDKFEKFLHTIIPKTRTLIRLVRKYITEKLSFVAVVKALEPFKIYTDDISYKQYMEIRKFIIDQIASKKEMLEKRRKEFGFIPNHRFNVTPQILSVIQFLLEKPDVLERCFLGYQLPERELLQKTYSTLEVLNKIIKMDNGVLLSKLITSIMSALMTPTSLSDLFNDEPIEDMGRTEKIKAMDCNRRVLTKRYSSMGELQQDNDKDDVFYDAEFDDTPYSIMSKYKDEKKSMLPDKFLRFLIENLIQKHDCPKERAEDLANTLIAGKKQVKDGEYAILIIKPTMENPDKEKQLTLDERRKMEDEANIRAKKSYYYRRRNTWVHYNEMEDAAFIDTSALFCNLKEQCISTTNNELGDTCESDDQAAKRMREIAKKRMADEFDRRFELSVEDMSANMENQIVYHIKYLQRLLRIESIQFEKQNNIAYQIGLEAAKYTDAVVSPHIELRDRIMGQSDFVKKQNDIVRLYDTFCREPMDLLSEDHGWKYCKESNTKLLPAFLYELATAFVRGEDYKLRLEEICHTHGLMSDSGNAIVDKNSGFVVRAIDFAEEDGYDAAGFKITTHAFIEKGEIDKAVENILDLYSNKSEKQVCEGEQAQMICALLESIAKQIGHPLVDIRDYCVRVASSLCDTLIDTEEKYNREAKKAEEKKGIKLPPYKKRKQQMTLLITAAVLFTGIQTETPSFNTKKTMPGCVKSFKGFPLDGEENTDGIRYLACVLTKMEKKIEPWNSIDRLTVAMIVEQIKRIMISAMKHPEVDERYLKKREYLLVNVEDDIPEEHSISKWKHFLPPIMDTNIVGNLRGVSADFKDEFISMMKKGHKGQRKDFMVLKSKISYFSYALIEAIQKIVKEKEVLLTAISTGQPFLQNVCCNEKERELIPLYYFARENPEIAQYVKTANAISTIIDTVLEVSKPAILYDPRNTKLKYPLLSGDISDQNIYAAFIHYCELDKGLGVPVKFHAFLTDIPVGYNARGSLDEKIEFLKRHDKRFTMSQLNELLRIVNSENKVVLHESSKYNTSEILKDLMITFQEHESPVIDKDLRENLYRVLVQYDKTKLMAIVEDADSSQLPEPEKKKIAAVKLLKDGLARIIEERFKPSVLSFLKKYGKMGGRDFNRLTELFDTFVKVWATPDLYKTANFIKNAVDEMTRIFPNILVTNATNTSRVHKYWDLADVDSVKIFNSIKGYYEPLGEFRQDRVLNKILLFIQNKFIDLRLFFDHLPIQQSIRIGSRDYFSLFDKDTIHLLLEYIMLSVLHEYIIATDDDAFVRLDRVEKKKANRARISEDNDVDIQFASEYVDLEEEYQGVYGDMTEVQIRAGNQDELKTRVAKMLLAFLTIMRKNKSEIDFSYENISASIRKRKEKEKNRIIERFKNMSEDERKVEDQKKKYKMDEWNVGTQRGIFEYDKKTSEREAREQAAEEELDIQKHGIRAADFMEIHGDNLDADDTLREMVDIDAMQTDLDQAAEEETETTGMVGLKRNFHDGQFYSDDESDDGFGQED
jgi:hypothetical protein